MGHAAASLSRIGCKRCNFACCRRGGDVLLPWGCQRLPEPLQPTAPASLPWVVLSCDGSSGMATSAAVLILKYPYPSVSSGVNLLIRFNRCFLCRSTLRIPCLTSYSRWAAAMALPGQGKFPRTIGNHSLSKFRSSETDGPLFLSPCVSHAWAFFCVFKASR